MPVPPSFPVIGVGDFVTADLLTSMLPSQVSKLNTTSRASTTTYTADPDLSAITLGIGTYEIEFFLLISFTGGTGQRMKTTWGFSGSWNNPVRGCIGPSGAAATPASRDAATEVNFNGALANADSLYQATNNALPLIVRESSSNVTVSTQGDLSLQWAQVTSSVNAAVVQVGSYVRIRQIG